MVGKKREDIVRECDNYLIFSLFEFCHNILKFNVHLNSAQKVKLYRHKHNLLNLFLRTTSFKHRKKYYNEVASSMHWIITQRWTPSKTLTTYWHIYLQRYFLQHDRANPAHAIKAESDRLQKKTFFIDEAVTVNMIKRIHSDIFQQVRFMLNDANVNVRIVRKKDSFCLVYCAANLSYKVIIISAVLLVCKVQLSHRTSWLMQKYSSLDCQSIPLEAWLETLEARFTSSRRETWTKIMRNCLRGNSNRDS